MDSTARSPRCKKRGNGGAGIGQSPSASGRAAIFAAASRPMAKRIRGAIRSKALIEESGVFAKSCAGVDVPSPFLRQHRGELGDRESTTECVYPAQDPNRNDEPWTSQLSSDPARSAQDARADRATDAHGDAKTYAYYAEQMTFGASQIKNCGRR